MSNKMHQLIGKNLLIASFAFSNLALAQSPLQVGSKPDPIPSKSIVTEIPSAIIEAPLTAHSAEYQVYYGSIELGLAKYKLLPTDTNFYTYQFDSDVGLLMLDDQRHIKSEFTLEAGKLIPYKYTQERTGTGSDFSEQTFFAKAQHFIHSIYKNDALKIPYTDNMFDPLMVQLQFRMDMIANKRPLEYNMVKELEVDDYSFRILGTEKLTVVGGTYDTIKIEVVRESKKRQTLFWMAPELAYLPVRLSHFSKGSKQLDIQLLKYKFDQKLPAIPEPIIEPIDAKTLTSTLADQADVDDDIISDDELDDIKKLTAD